MKKIYASLVVCERVLTEIDGVTSLIRTVDVFAVKPLAEGETLPDGATVNISVLVSLRITEYDDEDHTSEIVMIRPSGEETAVGEPAVAKLVRRVTNAPGGMNFIVQLGVFPKEWGIHTLQLKFDGEVVGETIFTLLQGDAWAELQTQQRNFALASAQQ